MLFSPTKNAEVNNALSSAYNEMLAEISPAVTTLLNEYKRKRDAWEMAVVTHRAEGDLDFGRIHAYKTSKDVFSTQTMRRRGQNHGIAVLIDASGSMDSVFSLVIRQAIVCAKFAQKAKIPYEIYLTGRRSQVNPTVTNISALQNGLNISPTAITMIASSDGSPSQQEKQLFSAFVFTDKSLMQNKDMAKCISEDSRLMTLRTHYNLTGSTLLFESVFALAQVAKEFKVRRSLENLTTLILTDGGDTEGLCYNKMNKQLADTGLMGCLEGEISSLDSMFVDNNSRRAFTLRELLSRDVQEADAFGNSYSNLFSAIIGYYRAVTNSKMCAIHLAGEHTQQEFYSFTRAQGASGKINASVKKAFGQNQYATFEGLLGFDTVNIMASKLMEREEKKSSRDKQRNISRMREEYKEQKENTQILQGLFDKMNMQSKYERILAANIADNICRDFEIQPKRRKHWFEV